MVIRFLLFMMVLYSLLLVASPAMSQEVFQLGRDGVYSFGAVRDNNGVSARGNFGLDLRLRERPVTLFRGEAQAGQTCGGFDYFANMASNLERIPGLLEGILQQFIASLPRLILCYASPTVCDLFKHFEAFMNAVVTAQMASCNEIQTAMAASGLRLRGGQAAKCLEDQQEAGVPLDLALDACLKQTSSLRSPRGERVQTYELYESTLGAFGADEATIQLITGMIGTLNVTANGQLLMAQTQTKNAVHLKYEALREAIEMAVDEAIAEAAGGEISEAAIRKISIPGQAMPGAVLHQLVKMRDDPVRFQAFKGKLVAGLAITQLVYDIREIRGILDGSINANKQIDAEERHLLEQASINLERALTRLVQNKETGERHLSPTFDAILAEGAALNHEAGQLAARAGSSEAVETALPNGQTTIGYSY